MAFALRKAMPPTQRMYLAPSKVAIRPLARLGYRWPNNNLAHFLLLAA